VFFQLSNSQREFLSIQPRLLVYTTSACKMTQSGARAV
jgi:hypothetical protein